MFIDDPEFNTSDYGWQNTPREIGLEDYYDARVVTFNSSSGYGEAIPLDKSPYKIPLIDRDFFTGNLVVSEEAFFWPDSGFVPAIGIYEKRFYLREQMGGKLPDQTKYIEVRENNLRCGYAKAIKL
jgi:hypothetical protein